MLATTLGLVLMAQAPAKAQLIQTPRTEGSLIQAKPSTTKTPWHPLDLPCLPAGTSTLMSSRIAELESKIIARDVAGARALLRVLPKRRLTLYWDDHKVPRDLRFGFEAERDKALQLVRKATELSIELADSPKGADISVSFEPELAVDPVAHVPRAVATFYHDEPGQPSFEIVLGVHRGNDVVAKPENILSDLAYALTGYFGVAPTQLPGAALNRTDAPSSNVPIGNTSELSVTEYNLEAIESLRSLEADLEVCDRWLPLLGGKYAIKAGNPVLFLQPDKLAPAKANLQGEPFVFDVQVTNAGSGLLNTKMVPDCNCFSLDREHNVSEGDTAIYRIYMDTALYGGRINKTLTLLTNDPQRPVVNIPVQVDIDPRYRFLTPNGTIDVLEAGHKSFEVFLAVDGKPLDISSARVENAPGTVKIEPWKGVMADPLHNSPAMMREGYKLTVKLSDNLLPGRRPFNIALDTSDQRLKTIRLSLAAQKGIAVMPDSLYFGELSGSSSANVTLSRPNKPFRILTARSTSPYIHVHFVKGGPKSEHVLTVKYDGQGSVGDISGTIVVTTDSPSQKTIKIPVTGSLS